MKAPTTYFHSCEIFQKMLLRKKKMLLRSASERFLKVAQRGVQAKCSGALSEAEQNF